MNSRILDDEIKAFRYAEVNNFQQLFSSRKSALKLTRIEVTYTYIRFIYEKTIRFIIFLSLNLYIPTLLL